MTYKYLFPKVRFNFLVLLFCINSAYSHDIVTVSDLKTEGLNINEGVTEIHPRMSWRISSEARGVEQQAYEMQVASSKHLLDKNMPDIYSSGKVNSNQSINLPYPLNNLKSCTAYYWRVKVHTNKGLTAWSVPAKWSMGILDQSLWIGKWIGTEKLNEYDRPFEPFSRLSARYFRKQTSLPDKPLRSTVFIAGLGLYELYINGKKVGKHVMSPTLKEYNKELPYNTLDVTDYLVKGANTFGVILGNGRYFSIRYSKDGGMVAGNTPSTHYGFPKLLLQVLMEYRGNKKVWMASDDSWKVTTEGPILTNNEFDGEEYDANKELINWNKNGFNDQSWQYATLLPVGSAKLVTQTNENIAVKDAIVPISAHQTKNNSTIIDLGQNMVGWLRIKVKGQKGDTITLRFAETLKSKDSLFLANIRTAKVTDKYILKSNQTEIWEPRFVLHGFRYVEISGLRSPGEVNQFLGKVVYDDIPTIGKFNTSNATINQVFKNAYWGIIGNYRGIPIDCPQRDERMGWLGDRSVSSYGESFLFDNSRLYSKWMGDIEAAQKESGSIPDVAPTYWINYTDDVTWPITFLIVPEMLRKQFGDTTTYRKQYPNMKKWVDYMWTTYQTEGLVQRDTYGDWCLPPENLNIIFSTDSTRNTKGNIIGAAYYYYAINLMKKYAIRLGLTQDVKKFESMLVAMKVAFNRKFYHADGYYSNNTVTANLLPLTFGLVEETNKAKVFNHIVQRTLNMYDGHISTGLIGGQWLMRGLSDYGRPDIAFKIASNTTYPSWGYMAKQGATTIWELWNGNTANPAMNSGNHVMLLGDLLVWDYEYLGGIKSDEEKIAFKNIVMDPYISPELSFVSAETKSPYGMIKSDWRKQSNAFNWKIEIPANCSATIAIKGNPDEIFEGNINSKVHPELKFLYQNNGKSYYQVGSGTYNFTARSY